MIQIQQQQQRRRSRNNNGLLLCLVVVTHPLYILIHLLLDFEHAVLCNRCLSIDRRFRPSSLPQNDAHSRSSKESTSTPGVQIQPHKGGVTTLTGRHSELVFVFAQHTLALSRTVVEIFAPSG